MAYEDYVNGYKYYLNFQKTQDDSQFSNHVKYQAHKHHNVEDIGKNILSRIPQTFEVPGEYETTRSDRFLHKHFTTNKETTPKKFYKSQTISLKLPTNEDYNLDTPLNNNEININNDKEYVIERPVTKENIRNENDVKILEDMLRTDESETDILEKALQKQLKHRKERKNHKLNRFFDKIKRKRKPTKRKRDDNTKCAKFCPFKKLRNWIGRKSTTPLKDTKLKSTTKSTLKQEDKDEKLDDMMREIPDIGGDSYSIENDDSIETFNNIDLESFKASTEGSIAAPSKKELTTIKQIVSTFPFIKNAEGRFSAAEKDLAPLFHTTEFTYEVVGVINKNVEIKRPTTTLSKLSEQDINSADKRKGFADNKLRETPKNNIVYKGFKKEQTNIHKSNPKDKINNCNENNKQIKQDPFQKAFNMVFNSSNAYLNTKFRSAKNNKYISNAKSEKHEFSNKLPENNQMDMKYDQKHLINKSIYKGNDVSPVRDKEINYITRNKDLNKNLKEDKSNYLSNTENYLGNRYKEIHKNHVTQNLKHKDINNKVGNVTEISFIDLDEIQKESSSTNTNEWMSTVQNFFNLHKKKKKKRFHKYRKRYFNNKSTTSPYNSEHIKISQSKIVDKKNELPRIKRAENGTFHWRKQPEGHAVFVYDLKRHKIPRDESYDTTNNNEITKNIEDNENRNEEEPSRTKRQFSNLKYSMSINQDSDQTNYKTEKEFTVKNVDEIEFIIDLLKNTSVENSQKENKKTNLQVHISIPDTIDNINKKRENKDVDFVRKIFAARFSTPVDMVFEVLSYENTVEPFVANKSITPGLYLLLNNNFTLPDTYSLIELKDLFKNTNIKKEINTINNNAPVTEPMKVTNVLEVETNKLLIKLLENLSKISKEGNKTNVEVTKDGKQDFIKELTKKLRNKRNLKKWFQIKPNKHCDEVNHTMCCVCAASDTVIREIMTEFDGLSSYMNNHCSEIQEYFYKNPSGGRKLKESVHKLDKIINEYYKRARACEKKDGYNTCMERSINLTKPDFIPNELDIYIDSLNHKLTSFTTNNSSNNKLVNTTDNFLLKLKRCLKDLFLDEDEKTRAKKECNKDFKNIYSVDKFNINIISYNIKRNDTNHTDETTKESKLLTFIKNLFPSCYNEKFTSENVTTLNNNEYTKEINKREANKAPLISDAGGNFWHDYLNRIYTDSLTTTEKPLNSMIFDLYNKLNNITSTKVYEDTTKVKETPNKTEVILNSINNNLEHLIDIIKDFKVTVTKPTEGVAENKATSNEITEANVNTEDIIEELEIPKTDDLDLVSVNSSDFFEDYNNNKTVEKKNVDLYKDLLLSMLKFEKNNIDFEEQKILAETYSKPYGIESTNKKVLREVTKKKCHHRYHELVKTTRPHDNATNLRVHPSVLNETPPTTTTTTMASTTIGDRNANTEACDPSIPNEKCLCDVRATYDYVLEKSRTMEQHQFETFVRNINCHKYIPVPNSFILEEVSDSDRRICRNKDYDYYENYDDNIDEQTEGTPRKIKFDWIRRKRSLLSTNKIESYIKDDFGIYRTRKRKNRGRRTVDLTSVYDGLTNLPDFDLTKDQIYVMQGDMVTITCEHTPNCPTQELDRHADFVWSASRGDMLKFSNVAIEADELTIRESEVKNGGSYNCSKGSQTLRSVDVTIVTVPEFRLVFLPTYDTGSYCQLKDLLAICANLAAEMKTAVCECDRICSLHIEEPVCMKEIGGSRTELRTIGIMTIQTKIKPFHCGAQCKRDIHAGLSLLCVGNLPNLLGVGVIINNHDENRTLSPAIPGEHKWTVTRTLHTKRNDYHRLASHMSHGDIDIVVVCPAGFYLQKKHKLCIACPMNTYSKEGDNSCHNCPAGTRTLNPGSKHCLSKLCRHRRYDWFNATWGYSVIIFTMLGFCLLGTIAGLTTQCACAQPTCEKCYSLETGSTNKWSKRKIASLSRLRKRPLSPSKVILTKFFNAPSTMATESHETKFSLWKEKNSPPALPPVDF